MIFVQKTNEEFLQELKDKNIIYIPLEEYKKYSKKIAWKCPKCENIFYATPSNIFQSRDYLKRGNDIGLCKYDPHENSSEACSKSVICIETQKIYKKIKDTAEDGFNPKCVSNCCNGVQSVHKSYHFEFYKEVS